VLRARATVIGSTTSSAAVTACLDRSTLAAWVGAAALEPLYDRLLAVLKSRNKLFADETGCPVLVNRWAASPESSSSTKISYLLRRWAIGRSGTGACRRSHNLDPQQIHSGIRRLDLDVERVAQRGQRGREFAGRDRPLAFGNQTRLGRHGEGLGRFFDGYSEGRQPRAKSRSDDPLN